MSNSKPLRFPVFVGLAAIHPEQVNTAFRSKPGIEEEADLATIASTPLAVAADAMLLDRFEPDPIPTAGLRSKHFRLG
jgi:hypothetical protein